MRKIRQKIPSPAMIVACLALTIALSGASYAAVVLPRNSVGTKQLKKSAVTAKKIKKGNVTRGKIAANSVTSAKVNNGTLLAGDFAADQLGPTLYVRVQNDGIISTPATTPVPYGPVNQARGVTQAMIQHTAATGRYCIGGLPFVPRSAMVATDSRDAPISNVIAGVATTRGTPLVGCPAGFDQVRVNMTLVDDIDEFASAADKAFYLWLQQ